MLSWVDVLPMAPLGHILVPSLLHIGFEQGAHTVWKCRLLNKINSIADQSGILCKGSKCSIATHCEHLHSRNMLTCFWKRPMTFFLTFLPNELAEPMHFLLYWYLFVFAHILVSVQSSQSACRDHANFHSLKTVRGIQTASAWDVSQLLLCWYRALPFGISWCILWTRNRLQKPFFQSRCLWHCWFFLGNITEVFFSGHEVSWGDMRCSEVTWRVLGYFV